MHHVKNVPKEEDIRTRQEERTDEGGHGGRTRDFKRDNSEEKRGGKMLYVI